MDLWWKFYWGTSPCMLKWLKTTLRVQSQLNFKWTTITFTRYMFTGISISEFFQYEWYAHCWFIWLQWLQVLWEPFIEPWQFQMVVIRKNEMSALLNSFIMTDIQLKSIGQLNLNFTESLIEVYYDLLFHLLPRSSLYLKEFFKCSFWQFKCHFNLIYIILKVIEWKYMQSYQTLAQKNWDFSINDYF